MNGAVQTKPTDFMNSVSAGVFRSTAMSELVCAYHNRVSNGVSFQIVTRLAYTV